MGTGLGTLELGFPFLHSRRRSSATNIRSIAGSDITERELQTLETQKTEGSRRGGGSERRVGK